LAAKNAKLAKESVVEIRVNDPNAGKPQRVEKRDFTAEALRTQRKFI